LLLDIAEGGWPLGIAGACYRVRHVSIARRPPISRQAVENQMFSTGLHSAYSP
jgi:hypothetical protein